MRDDSAVWLLDSSFGLYCRAFKLPAVPQRPGARTWRQFEKPDASNTRLRVPKLALSRTLPSRTRVFDAC
jgi:hypothetical protein